VHPQSVVHSLVVYRDGSTLAQLGAPDMRTPIAVALAWPRRMAVPDVRLDLAAVRSLTFEPPDEVRFPALRLARQVLRAGGAAPVVLNAANEVAVEAFLQRRIGFLDIAAIVEATLDSCPGWHPADIAGVKAIDEQARATAAGLMAGKGGTVRRDARTA